MPRKKKEETTFAGTSHVILIMDESGSMNHLTAQGRQLIDEQFQAARSVPLGQDVRFTAAMFGTHLIGHVRYDMKAADPRAYTSPGINYQPTGGTPLHDAVGKVLTDLKKRVGKEDRALVVIFTDGQENASTEWDAKDVAALVGKLQKKNWTFTFAAVGLDDWVAKNQARNIGIDGLFVVSTPVASAGTLGTTSRGYAGTTTSYLRSNTAKDDVMVAQSVASTQRELDEETSNS